MREAFLSFHEKNGHKRIGRYPVAARWRDDIYLTIASIADFQPYVTAGIVPPPANPLTISQPCIRLNDLDSVGRSGRHLTTFEMMAHHAFNTDTEEIYWKDRTVELCDQFIASIGGELNKVTYKEHPWIGGGNAGPSVEVLIAGLEVATLVFMNLGRNKTDAPGIDLNGEMYFPMKTRVVDTGYGLERFVWASKGSPTIYDAIFPDLVSRVMSDAGLEHYLDNVEYAKVLSLNAKFAGLMDISGPNLYSLREKVAHEINIPVEKLDRMMNPIERAYAIVDHTRCLAYMLGDCIVPSNVREGYLARLVLRRTLRMMNEIKLDTPLEEFIEIQMRRIGLDSFEQELGLVREIVGREVEKYRLTLERGTRIVQKLARNYKSKSERIPLNEMITLYDSHGIPPEITRDIAIAESAVVEFPDNFYSLVADMHSSSEEGIAHNPYEKYHDRLRKLPATKRLYYELPADMEFEATILDTFDGFLVLDQTLFYPEGGGQPADTGMIISSDIVARIEDVVKIGDVIIHKTDSNNLKRGERIKGMIDENRRWSLMRHHTATHILLHASKEVLGPHIHQSGAQKGMEGSRIDIRHYKHITEEEINQIENAANRIVMQDESVRISVEDRVRAEAKHGFSLYQGGVPPGREIRVVQVSGDVEACAGTHCRRTGEVGFIKIDRVEHIQDGVERIEFTAGSAAVQKVQEIIKLIDSAAKTLSVQRENLPLSASRFFSEWKEQKKELEKLGKRIVDLETGTIKGELIHGKMVYVKQLDLPGRELAALAQNLSKENVITLFMNSENPCRVVATSGSPSVSAHDLVTEVCGILGGKGGGNQKMAQGTGIFLNEADAALDKGKRKIAAAFND